ncbi:unnamed protein product [Gongylonema pulchrum]|uniref:Uncharacterized protein n=1 Tax=Gongylonema pulchrum TaxID=637853 RepID=A0A3P7NFB3_9BILA|nr:unnamed protein product [Gongylonema pulchrum]
MYIVVEFVCELCQQCAKAFVDALQGFHSGFEALMAPWTALGDLIKQFGSLLRRGSSSKILKLNGSFSRRML